MLVESEPQVMTWMRLTPRVYLGSDVLEGRPCSESVKLRVMLRSPCPVREFAFGVRHDPTAVHPTLATVSWSSRDPDWASTSLEANGECGFGVTIAAIGSQSSPGDLALTPNENHIVAEIDYARLSLESSVTGFEIVDCLMPASGAPAVASVVTCPTGSLPLHSSNLEVPLGQGCVRLRRAFCNEDELLDLSDAIAILSFLFIGQEVPCQAACDVNGDRSLDISDSLYLLGYLFGGSNPPVGPFESCATVDSAELDLTCSRGSTICGR